MPENTVNFRINAENLSVLYFCRKKCFSNRKNCLPTVGVSSFFGIPGLQNPHLTFLEKPANQKNNKQSKGRKIKREAYKLCG